MPKSIRSSSIEGFSHDFITLFGGCPVLVNQIGELPRILASKISITLYCIVKLVPSHALIAELEQQLGNELLDCLLSWLGCTAQNLILTHVGRHTVLSFNE